MRPLAVGQRLAIHRHGISCHYLEVDGMACFSFADLQEVCRTVPCFRHCGVKDVLVGTRTPGSF